jgi:cysteine desulfurase
MKVYLDNAATTQIDPRVAETMLPFLKDQFGNPSSVHAFGRESKSLVEKARKKIAGLIGTQPAQVFFTSGGTEADNMAIISSIRSKKIKRAISSPLEHHAVLHALENLATSGEVELKLLEVDTEGNLNLNQLWDWMEEVPESFVSLMQANNEIGNFYPVEEIAAEVRSRGGVFHSDTVQTVGKVIHRFDDWKADFMIASAHKFHGPKGVGFIAISSDCKIPAFIQGGSQERNMRGGTENIMGIAGMAEALAISLNEMVQNKRHIQSLKNRMKQQLISGIQGIRFNGRSGEVDSLYSILNVSLPPSELSEMLLFNLDIQGIAASGGSACSSGSDIGSHVLHAIGADPDRAAVRFSFSKFNTEEEIDFASNALCKLYSTVQV